MARALEEAGFASLWVSDHVVLPTRMDSPYPFAADGRATWPSTTPYLDALVALAVMAAATERVALGTAVLVLPLRHPVVSPSRPPRSTCSAAAGSRSASARLAARGVRALNVPFEDRGKRLVEWMAIARDCWTGTPAARSSERYELPEGVLCLPTPAHEIPFLMGGHSPAALRRAGRLADGWLAQQSLLSSTRTSWRARSRSSARRRRRPAATRARCGRAAASSSPPAAARSRGRDPGARAAGWAS
jgi:alkanesulfonate monooxygenase SsuD/methylene tetrahydromethanopterin reductase-like flavin-dependent oxidoreductase (luciferase family)